AHMLLSVGSGFRIKGLDRTLTALSRLPAELRANTHLFVVGQDKARGFLRQANALGLTTVHFLGGRNDVAELMVAADLLLHPAYSENTGTVLLEAVTSGLPVICTARCGYAAHVQAANAGVVLSEPFSLDRYMLEVMRLLRNAQERKHLAEQGRTFAAQADWFSMPERAAQLLLDSLV
ncbi:MAG TPA: glycosyltransferase, partial [Candidatus Kapabacteria bacterium]|nr:glycosyltransferase [Candidatus Kapabacteria bacterium]